MDKPIINIEDEDGVDVKGLYVTGAYGLGYDDVVVLFALSPTPSADGLVGSNIDLISWRILKKIKNRYCFVLIIPLYENSMSEKNITILSKEFLSKNCIIKNLGI